MTPEHWRKVEELFQAAAELPRPERATFLGGACAGDASLRQEVEALLAADRDSDDVLEGIASTVVSAWAAESESHDLIGRIFGHYEILSRLGSGGMGEVFLALDTNLQRKVALKLLPRQFTGDRDRLRRFEQEARAASGLNHPHIITIHEIGEWEGTRYIASEYIAGETLRDRSAAKRFTIAEILEIGVQATSALAAAHAAGIVHRDIKPANIMLRSDGYVKVLDFGLAKLTAAQPHLDVTEAGRVMGTINYMSPCQALGQPVDQRTDIFSLGVVLHELATGQRLFEGESDAAVYEAILHRPVPSLRDFAPASPPELDAVLRRALEKDRDRRYQTAADFRADLKRLADGNRGTEAARSAAAERRAIVRSRNLRYISGLVILLVLAVAAFLFYERFFPANPNGAPPRGISQKSLAVLPFENLSMDQTNVYFAEGIQDEILTRLSKIADLKVIARTSTAHYQSAPGNLKEIARQLGVANFLEGSLQKSGDSVRVSAQLIEAASGRQIWAETFDRKLTDIFSAESEMAKAIAEKLRVKITGREEEVIEAKPTDNPEAYDAYLRALSITLKPAITPANYIKAQQYLRDAVQRDPKFALAWALLSFVEARGYRTRALQATPALLEEARQAADTAFALQPTLGEAVLAKGYFYYSCLIDYENATLYLEQAFRFLPNSSRIPESLAYVARRQGQWDRSDSYFKQAVNLDPRNVSILTQWVNTDFMRRRFEAAAPKVEQILQIVPDDPDTLVLKAAIAQAKGDLPTAAALLQPLKPATGNINAMEAKAYQAVLERHTEQIIPRLQEIADHPDSTLGFYNGELRFWLGWAQDIAGDHASAERTWQEARTLLADFFKEQPENERLLKDLVLVYIMLKDRAAFALIDQVKVIDPIEKDALDGPEVIELLARAEAMMGAPDRALASLEETLSTPYEGLWGANVPLTPAIAGLDPMFDSLRGDPRFEKLASAASSPYRPSSRAPSIGTKVNSPPRR